MNEEVAMNMKTDVGVI